MKLGAKMHFEITTTAKKKKKKMFIETTGNKRLSSTHVIYNRQTFCTINFNH